MKKKIIAILLVLVALISTVGVGFATWVISRPVEEDIQGQIKVDVVSEESLTVTLAWGDLESNAFTELAEGKPHFNLVAPAAESAVNGDWLTYSGTDAARMSITLQINVAREDGKLFTGKVYVSEGFLSEQTLVGELSNVVADAVSANLLVAPTYDGTPVNSGAHNGAYEVQISNGVGYLTITLAWGQHFGGQNPYTYYNDNKRADDVVSQSDPSTTYADDAKASLQMLNSIFGGTNGENATAGSQIIGYTVYASASDATAWTDAN